MYHSFFIHSSTDGHLACFQILAIAKNAARNIGVHIFFPISVWGFFPDEFPEVESLGRKAVPILTFWGNCTLFSTVAAPVCIPTNRAWGFSPRPHQPLLFVDLSMIAILTGVISYLSETIFFIVLKFLLFPAWDVFLLSCFLFLLL